MTNLTRLSFVTLVLFAFWTTQVHAGYRTWTVEDTWHAQTKTFPPKTKTLSSTTETETSTRDFTDADGNTVRETTVKTYNVSGTVTEYWVQKAQFWRLEKTTRKGALKVKQHRGRTYKVLDRTENNTQRTLVGTETSESIIAYAPKPEPVVEETTSSASSGNYAVNLDFGAATQYLGTPTEMVSNESSYYANLPEFRQNNADVKQDAALARGWTGKGSTIAIIDSGIDLDHSEFNSDGKIVYQLDRTGTGIQDNIGHGSHVASIAAGELDGSGTMGIAPDANLAILKITDNWNVSTREAIRAIKQTKEAGVDVTVYNFSGNTNYSADYKESITYQGNGIYTSDHVYYGGENYYNLDTPNGWANQLADTESVLVVSAGNGSHGYVQNPATFATATNSDGTLMLDGRMIIAGNWNTSTQTVEGAGAGHVCKSWDGAQCNDLYRTSDFYLLAPGMGVTGANYDGTYRQLSGTSQAAPVISGGVAVIHQMWPYMKGSDIVKVLLATGNKDLPNYAVETHGQGMMDLDAATRPYGDIGISYTGRTGTTVPISGSLSTAGGDASGALSSISVVDGLDREYKVNVSAFSQTHDLIPVYQLDHRAGNAWSSKFVGGTQEHRGMHFATYDTPATLEREAFTNISLGFDTSAFSKRDPNTGEVMHREDWNHKVTMTQSAYSPFVSFNGMFGQVNSTTTFEYSTLYQPNNFYGQAGVMYSLTDIDSGLVKDVTPITSVYALAGWSNDNLNLYTGIKPMIVDGSLELNLPTSVDYNGNMHYTNTNIGLNNDPISFVGAQFTSDKVIDKYDNTHSLKMNGVVDQNNQYKVGAFYEFTF